MSVYTKRRDEFQVAVADHAGELPCTAKPNDWFAEPGSKVAQAAQIACLTCPIYWACREYAIAAGVPNGIWGGVDERTRERIWRNSPDGKPLHFLEEMDAALLPLLQARRDHENFDAQHPQEEEEGEAA